MSNKQPNILFAFADDWGGTPVPIVRWKGIKPSMFFQRPLILTASPTTFGVTTPLDASAHPCYDDSL